MATALQCPACGFKHRLDAVADTPVFACTRCERQLKLPAQFRNGVAARPGEAAQPRGKNAAPTNNRGAPASAAGAAAGSVSPPRRSTRTASGYAGPARIPLKILVWVLAFVLGAGVVRVLASWTGFVDTNTFLDLMLDHSFSTYWRLLILIPVWAFFATLFATAFIEGPGWWARRSLPSTKPTISRRLPAAAPSTSKSKSKTAPAPQPNSRSPRRVPARADVDAPPAPSRAESTGRGTKPAPLPQVEDVEPTSTQRPRRIPRRDTAS